MKPLIKHSLVTAIILLALTASTWGVTPVYANTISSAPASLTVTLKSIGEQDGWVLESSETSGFGGTMNSAAATFTLGDDATRKQYRSFLSFNSGAALPDNAVITGVTLKVMKSMIVGKPDPVSIFKGIYLDFKNGFFSGNASLQIADFQAAASQSLGPFSPTLTGGWYTFNLPAATPFINKLSANSGVTQIRMRFAQDDNNDAVANYLSLYSGNAPEAYKPQLIITYTKP